MCNKACSFIEYLVNSAQSDDVEPMLKDAMQGATFDDLKDAQLSDVSHHLLEHCQQGDIPKVLRALTCTYQNWIFHLLGNIDKELAVCTEMNEMALREDLEWLLPGRLEFWHQLSNTLHALREDIRDFNETRGEEG